MSVSDRVIAIANKTRHDDLCREIARDLPTFIRIGSRLKELQQLEVYKETHKSFEAFVLAEFGLSRARAYQLIEAAEVDANLSTIVDNRPQNEAQLREVAKAPPEQQAEVVKKAVEKAAEENRKPTSKDYKQAVKQVVGEIVYENVEPEKPTSISTDEQIKTERKKAKSYAEYLQRSIDDLNHLKRNKVLHPELIKLCGKILEGLERW